MPTPAAVINGLKTITLYGFSNLSASVLYKAASIRHRMVVLTVDGLEVGPVDDPVNGDIDEPDEDDAS